MREVPLTTVKGGINRLKTKGGARGDSLYDAVNCYRTEAGTVKRRPGTLRVATLDSATKGLVAFDGARHTFAAQTVEVPDGYVLHVITHPSATPDAPIAISLIHFAEPFLGFLYVVAEFVNGDVFHYWLQLTGTWSANTIYRNGDIVEPTVPNGLAYRATRFGPAYPSWTPRTPKSVGDTIEPTVYNDYYYTVIDAIGSNPATGDTEPTWPQVEAAQVVEDTEGVLDASGSVTAPPANQPTSGVSDRYSNPGGEVP